MIELTGLEVLLGVLLVAIVVCVLYLRFGLRKPGPGGREQ